MQELSAQDLALVAGGSSKSDQLTQTLTQVTSSIKDLSSNQNNSSSSSTTTMLMLAMMMNRPQPTVVAPASGTIVTAGPSINVRARVRF